MLAAIFRRFGAIALALALLPLAAGAQGLPTGKRQHKPVNVTTEPATSPDPAYQLDPEAGEIRFGDGTQGQRPPNGESAGKVPSYRTGTPARQSVPAGTAASQHNQSDLDFLKERARKADDSGRKAQDSGREADDPAREDSDRDR